MDEPPSSTTTADAATTPIHQPDSPVTAIARNARQASHALQIISPAAINDALDKIYSHLDANRARILDANQLDLDNYIRQHATTTATNDNDPHQSLSPSQAALYARLKLSPEKLEAMLTGILDLQRLAPPQGRVTLATRLDEDLDLYRITCPVGVLLIIFEARPEVVVQIGCLALKSGNAVILKGGKEAHHSNQMLFQLMHEALSAPPPTTSEASSATANTIDPETVVPPNAIQLVSTRDEIATLLQLDAYIDLAIPRGSNQLVKYVKDNTRIPVLGHADGICCAFINHDADIEQAIAVIVDAKTNYPAACNALETLIIHQQALDRILPRLAEALWVKGVKLRADPPSHHLLSTHPLTSPLVAANPTSLHPAAPADYTTEYLSLTLCVCTAPSLAHAIHHINTHSSHHTDTILTKTHADAERFLASVDSANVFCNASTRFSDGFRYGFGAEIGVSTAKTHARGPVGLEGLVIYKYRLYGNGQGAGMYGAGEGKLSFVHVPIEPPDYTKGVKALLGTSKGPSRAGLVPGSKDGKKCIVM